MFASTKHAPRARALGRFPRHAHRPFRTMRLVWRLVTASLGLALVLTVVGPVAATARASSAPVDGAAIDNYVAARMQAPPIPGVALAIVKDDHVVYLKGYGQADPHGDPVTPQTPFVIGSISKAFTSLAVMQLVEAGKVDLDAPVQRYLPWFRVADPQASAQITVRELLTMTSGISGGGALATFTWTDQDDGALDRHVRYLAQVGMEQPPGQSFVYSNANYDTLGAIVQAVSGQSYEDYVRQHILAPLDMQHTFMSEEDARAHGMATGYIWWFGIPVATTTPFNRGDLPAGFIISSAEDMSHFLIAQMNGGRYGDRSVLSPVGIALMHAEPVPNTYAMGWETTELDGRTLDQPRRRPAHLPGLGVLRPRDAGGRVRGCQRARLAGCVLVTVRVLDVGRDHDARHGRQPAGHGQRPAAARPGAGARAAHPSPGSGAPDPDRRPRGRASAGAGSLPPFGAPRRRRLARSCSRAPGSSRGCTLCGRRRSCI